MEKKCCPNCGYDRAVPQAKKAPKLGSVCKQFPSSRNYSRYQVCLRCGFHYIPGFNTRKHF